MGRKKTIREKPANDSKIVDDPKGRGEMLVPSGLQIEELIQKIPKGHVVTIGWIREYLATEAGVSLTCPLVTGIMVRLIAEAEVAGQSTAPWWRVVKDKGILHDKFPSAPDEQKIRLQKEGVELIPYRNSFKVKNFTTQSSASSRT
jgi:alkylated DNA nucleotide flippase Atl1